jgi:hypothetical protein
MNVLYSTTATAATSTSAVDDTRVKITGATLS